MLTAPSPPAPAGVVRRTEHLEILNEIARIATLDLELRPMLQRITDALMRKFAWEFVACVSLDWSRGRFVCEALSTTLPTQVFVGYNREIGTGVVGEVALTGRAVLLDDVRGHPNFVETQTGTLSELCVPVRHRGETVALLNLESPRLAAFHDQLPLLETVAEQIAGAIASARLHQELTHRARLLEMVGEVSKAAMDAGELQLLLQRVVEYIHAHFPLALASIMLADEDEGQFTQMAHAGELFAHALKGSRWPLREGIVGRSIRLGEPQLSTDVSTDPDYFAINDRVTAEYVVPIRFRGQVLGVLNLESETAEVFSQENLVAFRAFADQLAGAIHMASMNQELEEANDRLREANQRLERLSAMDGLTELANRRNFDQALAVEWRRAARSGQPLSLIMIDIDCFKPYNDTYGHRQGDNCLRDVAGVLRGAVQRAGEVVARYGGEEFAVLLPGIDEEHARTFAELLRKRVEDLHIPHQASSVGKGVTVSLGVATVTPSPRLSPNDLVDGADRALYEAKHAGRNRVVVAASSA